MRTLAVIESMTLDGVVQAPAYADEDTDGGSGTAAGTSDSSTNRRLRLVEAR